jgi:hypothetical protein
MSWKNDKPGRFSLQAAAQEIMVGTRVSASSIGVRVEAVKNGSVVAVGSGDNSLDYLFRLAMWGLLPAMFFAAIWAAMHPFMYGQGGIFVVAFLFGGLGVTCSKNLQGSFDSRVREQLGKAKAATSKEEMLIETLLLVWGMREARPALARIKDISVRWNEYSNNTDLFAIQPAQRALALLAEMPDDAKKFDWARRMNFDGFLDQIGQKLDTLDSMWDRVVHIPDYIHRGCFYLGGFLTVVHLLGPLAERFQ